MDNAAASKIGIVSALTTIDFGSADASNKYHAAKYVGKRRISLKFQSIFYILIDLWSFAATANTVSIGQSAIVMSPGQCENIQISNSELQFYKNMNNRK